MSVRLDVVNADGSVMESRDSLCGLHSGRRSSAYSVAEVVKWQLSKKRSGTHSTKTRSQVSGGGTKPWRQKGTGRARAGSRRSPLWVGGGVVHGPSPRSYYSKLNKKVRRAALSQLLSLRAEEGSVVVVESFAFSYFKTREAAALIKRLSLDSRGKLLVLYSEQESSVLRAFRNLPDVKALPSEALNVYDLANAQALLLSLSALCSVEERFAVSAPRTEDACAV